ncbi:DJ-1/PfpI family protein [Chromatiaceae bacterium AAb-1]|nr:DJ-1/PfpI family protein [Chromatiaceae bacterium AAb-1]
MTAADYKAVFVVGGKGAIFDLPQHTPLQTLLDAILQHNGVIFAVCHGPTALIDIILPDGSYLVAGKAVSAFTNEEEQLFGKKWLAHYPYPFLLHFPAVNMRCQ